LGTGKPSRRSRENFVSLSETMLPGFLEFVVHAYGASRAAQQFEKRGEPFDQRQIGACCK